ncbi:MAG: NADH-quinone oxidoreductase subunit C [Candidatus Eiseniibacteriota bacterium]|nr:MAG: NADH-quinone oxidoreductase subunit C [Candidatus Eisenbacteria bacterium]
MRERFGEKAVVETHESLGEVTVVLAREALVDAAKLLRDDPELGFDFLSDLCGVDWPGRRDRFEVVYHLYSIKHTARLRLKVRLTEDDTSLPSVSGIWPTANWHEREAFDMYGIVFLGHPDLRRILNPDDFEGFPFRKDFPIN